MAYVIGTALSLADLVTAIRNACTANGWTLNGDVLSKNGCHAEVMLSSAGDEAPAPYPGVRVRVGNEVDGATLIEAPAGQGSMRPLRVGTSYPDWDWPVTYHAHVLTDPDEVYVFVNYHGTFWQNVMFGRSPAIGNSGTGNWFHGTIPRLGRSDVYRYVDGFSVHPGGATLNYFNYGVMCGAPFFHGTKSTGGPAYLSAQMHGAMHDGDSGAPIWSHEELVLQSSGTANGRVSSATGQHPLLSYMPNAWNDSTALVRCQILQGRPENKTSLIGELRHLRFVRNDFINDGEVIELGHDRWKVYPFYRKNVSARNGGQRIDHSGTMAMAIRYDGP